MSEKEIRLINFPEGFRYQSPRSTRGFSWKLMKLYGPYKSPFFSKDQGMRSFPDNELIFILGVRSDNITFTAMVPFPNDSPARSRNNLTFFSSQINEGVGALNDVIDGGMGRPYYEHHDLWIAECQANERKHPGEDHSLKTFVHHDDGNFYLEAPCPKSE
jgi:hypothetical protein